MTRCFSPTSFITVFFASLKHSSSTSIRRVRLHQVVVLAVCICGINGFLLYFRSLFKAQFREETQNLYVRKPLCSIEHSFSVYSANSSHILRNFLWVFCLARYQISMSSTARRFAKTVHLHLSYEEPIPWKAVKHLSRVLWPLQPVQTNFYPLMTLTESD